MSVFSFHRAAWLAAGCLAVAALGCSSSNQPAPKGEVVDVEVIDNAPANTPLHAQAVIEAKASAEKKIEEAKAAADAAIREAERELDLPAPQSEPSNAAPAPPAAPAAAAPAPTDGAAAPAARVPVTLGDPTLTAGVPGAGPITLAEIDDWLAAPGNFVELEPILPLGLSQGAAQVTGLDANPLTRAKIELGRQLYFDPRLSADSTVSCASCHNPTEGYSAHTTTGIGIRGQAGGRNSPVSFNRILSGAQFWDGRADSLEAQAVGPIANPIEMGFTHEGVVKRLGEIPVYKRQFEKIFNELTIDRVGQAIAAFERVLVTAPSPYDFNEQLRSFAGLDEEDIAEDPDLAKRYAAAKEAAERHPMSDSAKRGREIFFTEKGNCTACHVGANLADEKYHNIGIGMDKETPDLGRFVVTKDEKDTGAFKTPTVRNVALSAPYMHDGSVATLEEVVEWYDKGGHPNPHLSDKIRQLNLTAQDKADLVEFMKACTGPTPSVEVSRLPADAE
jgi:cytochrome c peroxidase